MEVRRRGSSEMIGSELGFPIVFKVAVIFKSGNHFQSGSWT